MRTKEIINQRFGKLVVRKLHSRSRNGHARFICDCDCGEVANILGTHLIQNKTKSCGCLIPKGIEHNKWTGVGEISGNFWNSHILRSANGEKGKRKALELNITKEFVWDLFLKQERKCALSGLPLKFPERFNDKSYTASLDRIDSSKGYTINNVQWVHKDINMMKNKLDQTYFIKLCKLVANDNCEIK